MAIAKERPSNSSNKEQGKEKYIGADGKEPGGCSAVAFHKGDPDGEAGNGAYGQQRT